jgi:hypothetical protein
MDRLLLLARALYVGAASLTLVAVVAFLTPRRDAMPQRAGALPVTQASAPIAHPSLDVADQRAIDDVVSRNVFSADRAAPKRPYVSATAAATAPASTITEPAVQLFGIAITPSGAQALIEANPRIPGAEVYRVGDRVGDYRLIQLSDSAAILESVKGRLVLRLRSAPVGTIPRSTRPQ